MLRKNAIFKLITNNFIKTSAKAWLYSKIFVNTNRFARKNLDDVERKIKEYFEKYGNMKENLSPKEVLQYKKALKEAIKKVPKDKTLKKMLVDDAPKYKIDRLRSLQADLQIMLAEATRGQEKGIYNSLDDVAKISQAVLAKSLQKKHRFKV